MTCIFFARIFYAPLDLGFATPVIERQTASFLPGWDVSYQTAKVGWDWRSVKPWIAIDNIQLVDRRDRLNASIPQIRVDVSFVSLFGSAGISSIHVDRPKIVVTDLAGFSDATSDNSFDALFRWDGPPRPEVFRPVTEAFSRFTTRLLKNAPRLEGVYLNNVAVDIVRGEGLPALSLAMPTLRLDHHDQKLNVSAQVDALIADQLTRVGLSGEAEPDVGELSLDVSVRDVSITSITKGMQLPEFFSYLNFPLGLDLELSLSSDEGLRGAKFELTIGEGYLYHKVAYPEQAVVNYGIIAGALNVLEDQVSLTEVELVLGDNRVTGDGLLYWEDGQDQAGIQVGLKLDQTSVSDVKKYWPIRVHPDGRPRGARAWVDDHMIGGTTENVEFNIQMNPDGTTPYPNNSLYQLTFDVTDVDTFYVRTMPELKNVRGRAVLTRQSFDVFVSSGTVMNMPVGGSVAHMENIHIREGAMGTFDLNVEGPVRKLFDLVDRKPVFISDKIEMDLDRLTGTARVEAKLVLPLVKSPPKDSVTFDVTAYIKAGGVQNLLGGEGLRNADLTLSVNGDELTTSGFGDINGVPMELYWREDFAKGRADPTADTSLLVMSGSPNEGDIAALGLDVSDYLKGYTRTEATFLGRNLKFRVGYFSSDTSDAQLMVSPMGWVKPPSSPASVNGTIDLSEGKVKLVPLIVTGEDIDLTANFEFGADGQGSYSGKVTATRLGKNKLMATLSKAGPMPLKVVASAEVFDAGPILSRTSVTENNRPESDTESGGTPVDFDLLLHADTLRLQNGEVLRAADLKLLFKNGEPEVLNFRAEDEGGTTSIVLGDGNADLRPLRAQTNNAGQLLRGLGLFAHMKGGALTLDGVTDSWGDTLTLTGSLSVKDTSLIAKSTLSAEVTEGVVSGLDGYLEDGAIELDIVEFPFSYVNGLLDISGMKANGPSLGMTMEGQIQTTEGKINVNGVVVPAYGLNSLLGKIPLVGSLFSGGAGKGLFGVTYRVKGSTEEPDVAINALSGLAPGFLRILFEGRKGKVSDVEVPVDAKPIDEDLSKPEGEKGDGK